MSPSRQLALRPALPSDREFLRRLYADTREAELAQVPWEAAQKQVFLNMQFEAQQRWYASAYPGAEHFIILLDEQPAGRWMVARDAHSILLVDIALLAEHRGHGVGAELIERLIAEAKAAGLPLRLQVQWTNPGALKLYRRLGFAVTGTDQMYCQMERRPPLPAVAAEQISLRPATEADEELLLTLYASTRADELAMVPWPPPQKQAFISAQFSAQKQHYASQYPHAEHHIICVGTPPVGRVYVAREKDRHHILDITIDPQKRNAGIGSAVIAQMLRQARSAGLPLTIYVEDFNPSARLFRRLGFAVAKKEGFQLLMQCG